MATMKTLNGYGFNATEFNGKAPEYYIQPRNLLDNSDFRNLVNQRGSSSYSGEFIYTIDRWKSGEGTPTLNIQDDGVKIKDDARTYPPYMYQTIEKLRAGTYTYAARFHNNTGIAALSNNLTDAGLIAIPSSRDENGTLILSFTITEDISADAAYFRLQGETNETSVTWEWAALYEGSYTADTLPPYVPKGYATELAECMRYYQKFQMLTGTDAYAAQRVFIILPVAMRITPTIAYELMSGAQPNNVVAQARNVIDVTGAASYSHLSISLSADL